MGFMPFEVTKHFGNLAVQPNILQAMPEPCLDPTLGARMDGKFKWLRGVLAGDGCGWDSSWIEV